MVFLKKEWKTLLLVIWMIGITYFLFAVNGRLNGMQLEDAQLMSTLDSVESVVLSTDNNIADMSKKIDGINSNVEFVVTKVRRR